MVIDLLGVPGHEIVMLAYPSYAFILIDCQIPNRRGIRDVMMGYGDGCGIETFRDIKGTNGDTNAGDGVMNQFQDI